MISLPKITIRPLFLMLVHKWLTKKPKQTTSLKWYGNQQPQQDSRSTTTKMQEKVNLQDCSVTRWMTHHHSMVRSERTAMIQSRQAPHTTTNALTLCTINKSLSRGKTMVLFLWMLVKVMQGPSKLLLTQLHLILFTPTIKELPQLKQLLNGLMEKLIWRMPN